MDGVGRLHERPGTDVTYTQNWPHEPLIGNQPTGGALVWSVVSFVLLLAGVGGMVWYFASQTTRRGRGNFAGQRPAAGAQAESIAACDREIFFCGGGVVGRASCAGRHHRALWRRRTGFYGFPLDRWLPYSVTRTWHLQLGIFWIATSWLATGLYVAPAVSGYEPKGQRLGVNALFGALLLVVVGSLAGEWLSIEQRSAISGSGLAHRVTNMSTLAASGKSCCSSDWSSGCGSCGVPSGPHSQA